MQDLDCIYAYMYTPYSRRAAASVGLDAATLWAQLRLGVTETRFYSKFSQSTQAFGAKQYQTVGVVYQRALLIGWLYALIITPFFLNIGRLLKWAGKFKPINLLS